MRFELSPRKFRPCLGWYRAVAAFLHKKLAAIQRGNEYNLARAYRQAQENLINARSDEERQASELTTARRQTLRGKGGRVRAGLRAAEQVYNSMQK